MATEICLTIEDDGTFSVDTEEAQQEEQEQPDTGNEQKFDSIDKAMAAVAQMAQAASLNGGGQHQTDQSQMQPAADDQDQQQAMMDNFRPGIRKG